jgi:hypothetical protein
MDYPVVNLGKDRDLVLNDINLEQAEKQHKHTLQASFEKPKGHPVDYKVPNFGVDNEILATQLHMKKAEKQLKKKMVGDFFDDNTPKYPLNYKVPNFGLDTDIKNTVSSLKSTEKKLGNWNPKKDSDGAYIVPTSAALQTDAQIAMGDDPVCSSAGCTQYKHPEAIAGHPMDYPVPSFGADPEIETTANSISIGEAMYNHKIIMGTEESKAQWDNPAKEAGSQYDFAPELDHDIKVSHTNLANAEQALGTTMDVQIGSDPICSSAGCTQYEHPKVKSHPMDYFVPNFGVDQSILDHNSALAIAEKQLNHTLVIDDMPKIPRNYPVANFGVDKDILETQASIAKTEGELGSWEPKQDENGFWIVPEAFSASSYNYHDRDVFVQLDEQSDPICSSAGCTQFKHPELKSHPMDYPVPNFGVDHDILASHSALNAAEKQLKHTWKWEELKEEDPVIYDDQKPLDVEIQHSLGSLGQQEEIHGAWNPTQNEDGEWIVPKPIDNSSYSYGEREVANIQLRDDPVCSSAGCTQYKHPEAIAGHPMDYPVPSFGADPEIETTANSISIGEAMYNHKIIMGTEESKAQWVNPATEAGSQYDFAPELDHDIKVTHTNLANAEEVLGTTMLQTQSSAQSDPICSSAGCTQYKHPDLPAGHPMNYPVPNFGVDSDIISGFQSLKAAEKIR